MSAAGNQGRTLDRAFDVLRCLEEARGLVRLSDISRQTGLHLATTQRIVATLVRAGYAQSSDMGYTLGPVVLAQAHAFVLQDPLVRAARPVLSELSESTRLTSSVYVRSGLERILVARVDAPEPMRYQFPLGRRLPLDVGAGKVLLAFMPEQELDAYVEGYEGRTLASGERQTAESLRAQLAEIQASGYHVVLSERHMATVSAVAVIRSSKGEPVGALNLVAHEDTVTVEGLRARIPELVRAGELIGQHL